MSLLGFCEVRQATVFDIVPYQCAELHWESSAPAGCKKLDTPDSASGGLKQRLERSRRDVSNWPSNETPLLGRQIADLQTTYLK